MGAQLETQQFMLHQPVGWAGRAVLVVGLLVMVAALRFPLWTMSFQSNQYPDPLRIAIHASHLEGQKTALRDDLREVNSLNHYIGMRPLMERDFSEFLWLPFVIGVFGLLALRTAVLGILRDLVDLVVVFTYFGLFGAWTFYHRLYEYGHNLAPDAAIKVAPFSPPTFGRVKIANFWVESYPGLGSYALVLFGLCVTVALALTLRQAWKRRRASVAAPAAAT